MWAEEWGVTTNKKYPFLAYDRGACFWDPVMNSFWFKKAEIKYMLLENEIIELLKERVLLAEITVGSLFKSYKGGVYGISSKEADDCAKGEKLSVAIVGSNTSSRGVRYYRIRVPWGYYWGYDGVIKLAFGINACGIRRVTAYPVPYSK